MKNITGFGIAILSVACCGLLAVLVSHSPARAPTAPSVLPTIAPAAAGAAVPAPLPNTPIAAPAAVLVSAPKAQVDWNQQFADSDEKTFRAVFERALQAVKNGDSEAAYVVSKSLSEPGKATPEVLATIQGDILDMVDSRKVNAMFSAGIMMASGPHASIDGLVVPFSMILAACRLGADCVSSRWAISGQPASFADALPALAPPDIYQKVDAGAQEIVESYRRGELLHPFATLTTGAEIKSPEGK